MRRGVVSALAFAISLALSLSGAGCDAVNTTGPTQCLGTLAPSTSTIPIGSATALLLTFGNPDNDQGGTNVVTWTVTGGGHLDDAETTLTQAAQTDQLGQAAGSVGTTTTAFHAEGPPGIYTARAAIAAGSGCLAASREATIQVTPAIAILDGGAPDGGSDASASDASDASAE